MHLYLVFLSQIPVASFTKEVNLRLAKRPVKTNGCLANLKITPLVKEATGVFRTVIAKEKCLNF